MPGIWHSAREILVEQLCCLSDKHFILAPLVAPSAVEICIVWRLCTPMVDACTFHGEQSLGVLTQMHHVLDVHGDLVKVVAFRIVTDDAVDFLVYKCLLCRRCQLCRRLCLCCLHVCILLNGSFSVLLMLSVLSGLRYSTSPLVLRSGERYSSPSPTDGFKSLFFQEIVDLTEMTTLCGEFVISNHG